MIKAIGSIFRKDRKKPIRFSNPPDQDQRTKALTKLIATSTVALGVASYAFIYGLIYLQKSDFKLQEQKRSEEMTSLQRELKLMQIKATEQEEIERASRAQKTQDTSRSFQLFLLNNQLEREKAFVSQLRAKASLAQNLENQAN